MSKIELDNITSGYNLGKINANFVKIENALTNNVLFRDATGSTAGPNQMVQDIDMDSQSILNLPTPTAPTNPVRLQDLGDYASDTELTEIDNRLTGDINALDGRVTTLEQGTSGDSRYIHWLYNNGSALGGEVQLNIPYDFTSIATVFINGVRMSYGLAFEYNVTAKTVTLAEALEVTDEVVVSLGTEPVQDYSDLVNDVQLAEIQDITKPYIFNNVSGMVNSAIVFPIGKTLETGGYYTKGDAGKAKYLIVAAQAADGYGDHTLANGTVAVLEVDKNNVALEQWGAKGDGVQDDLLNLNAAYAWCTGDCSIRVRLNNAIGLFILKGYNITFGGTLYLSDSFTFKHVTGFKLGLTLAPHPTLFLRGEYLIDTTKSTLQTSSVGWDFSGVMQCGFESNGIKDGWSLGATLSGIIYEFVSVGVHCAEYVSGGIKYGHEFTTTEKSRIVKTDWPYAVPAHVTLQTGILLEYPDTVIAGIIQADTGIDFRSSVLLIRSGCHVYAGANSIVCSPSSAGLQAVGAYFDSAKMVLYNNADIKSCTLNCAAANPAITIMDGYGVNVNIIGNLFHGTDNSNPAAIVYEGLPATSTMKQVIAHSNTARSCSVTETAPYKIARSSSGQVTHTFIYSGLVDVVTKATAEIKVDGGSLYDAKVAYVDVDSKVLITKMYLGRDPTDSTIRLWQDTNAGNIINLNLWFR